MIDIRNLKKSYGQNHVLKGINLKFENGHVYGIVGENGAGKTTLFQCLAGLDYYQGEVNSSWNPLKNHLSYLKTNPFFFEKLTGYEYLQLLSNARKIPFENIDYQNIFDLPLGQYAKTYSTGMKKKLALLALLLIKSDVYILDEPFNGVDIQSNIIIEEIIHQLKAKDKIVIISSHIFSTLEKTCDEIHLLKDGQIAKSVQKADFPKLEEEMKRVTVQDKIDRLGF